MPAIHQLIWQLVWQASYKTWGSTVAEEWEVKTLSGDAVHPLDAGDSPRKTEQQQNLRFQGQYLDRDTGLHYNTFRDYDPDMGRFICPDPIGLEGGINLGSYSANPLMWIDPLGLDELYVLVAKKDGWYNVYEYGKKAPVGQVYLKEGEVWKIGESKNGSKRYTGKYLKSEGVEYKTIYEGTTKSTNRFWERMRLKGYFAWKGRLPPGNLSEPRVFEVCEEQTHFTR